MCKLTGPAPKGAGFLFTIHKSEKDQPKGFREVSHMTINVMQAQRKRHITVKKKQFREEQERENEKNDEHDEKSNRTGTDQNTGVGSLSFLQGSS